MGKGMHDSQAVQRWCGRVVVTCSPKHTGGWLGQSGRGGLRVSGLYIAV
jgi:hypothetical protein